MTKLDRRSVLIGSLAGVTVGAGAGFASASLARQGAVSSALAPFDADGAKPSYAQQGEDRIVKNLLAVLGIAKPLYVDIGAHHPSINSNTYLFYKAGARGLLVEPNPQYAELLVQRRAGDTVLEAGIGVSSAKEADYYMMAGDGQLNTFSKEQADALVKRSGPAALVKVVKKPLVNVNDAFVVHLGGAAPDFMSLDVEGLDYEILKSLDWGRFRPKVVCVETCELDGEVHQGILGLMAEKEYVIRGATYVNTVFLDKRAWQQRGKGDREG